MLRVLFIAHAVVTFAAGIVLIVAPGVIPSAVGIDLPPEANLVAYLLGACEIGVAVVSVLASRLTDVRAIQAISLGFIVLHLATAVVELFAFVQGVDAFVLANVALRLVVAALFGYLGVYRPRNPGR